MIRTKIVATMGPACGDVETLYRLFEAFIGLRERNDRQHKSFERSLTESRDTIKASFNSFATRSENRIPANSQTTCGRCATRRANSRDSRSKF